MSVHYNDKYSYWYFRVRINIDGKTTQKAVGQYESKEVAIVEEAKYKLHHNKVKNRDINNLKFHEVAEQWLEYKRKRLKTSTYYSYIHVYKKHIEKHFYNKKLIKLNVNDIKSFSKLIEDKKLNHEYSNKILMIVKNIFTYAIKNEWIEKNPAYFIDNFVKPKDVRTTFDYWTFEEFKQFYNNIPDDDVMYKSLFNFLYFTGARLGEALALQWRDINFLNNEVMITKTLQQKKKFVDGYVLTPPKTKGSNRKIDLFDVTVNQLTLLKKFYIENMNYTDEGFVFGLTRALSETSIRRKKNDYCKLAEVKQIKIHDFRHSHASFILNNTTNMNIEIKIYTLAKRLGHTDIKMTMNQYSHLFESNQKDLISNTIIKL